MRNAGRLKLGWFPLPPAEGTRLRKLLHFTDAASVLDPCAGTGAALLQLTQNTSCTRYAVELDATRAQVAQANGIQTIQGNLFDTHAKVESFSLLYLNPPYDSEIGSLNNQRMELLFLEHTYRWLVVGGVLMFVVPEKRLSVCISLLASNFTDIRIFNLTDPESVRYNQVALTAVRKPMRGNAMELNRVSLQRKLFNQPLLDLQEEHEPYTVPATPPASIVYRGLPLDAIEDLILQSSAWKQVAPFLLPREEMVSGRPITPLHAGHVGLLCTAGLLNGVFGQGADRHIARWRSVKHTTIITEEEDNVEITRKRERFSNELSLIYQDGRKLVLTESAKKPEEQADAECTSTPGAA